MEYDLIEYMENEGWTIEWNPFLKILHSDGSKATEFAAQIVMDYYRKELAIADGYLD